jgi:hypothetical protein
MGASFKGHMRLINYDASGLHQHEKREHGKACSSSRWQFFIIILALLTLAGMIAYYAETQVNQEKSKILSEE